MMTETTISSSSTAMGSARLEAVIPNPPPDEPAELDKDQREAIAQMVRQEPWSSRRHCSRRMGMSLSSHACWIREGVGVGCVAGLLQAARNRSLPAAQPATARAPSETPGRPKPAFPVSRTFERVT